MNHQSTDHKLATALLKLMKKTDLRAITMQEIADQSQVNRTTVYRHFFDKYEIIEKIEEHLFTQIKQTDQQVLQKDTSEQVSLDSGQGALAILEVLNQNRYVLKILLSPHGDPHFQEKLQACFLELSTLNIMHLSKSYKPAKQTGTLIQFSSAGLIGLLKYWTQHEDIDIHEIYAVFKQFTTHGLQNYL